MDGGIAQVAYSVADLRGSAQRWVDALGVGPFFLFDHVPVATATSRGEAVAYDHSVAFAQWGAVQLELIEWHRAAPETFADAIGSRRLGLHHVARIVPDVDLESRRLTALGWPCVLDGHTGTGLRFVFHDARAELGHHVEIYANSPQVASHYAAVRRAAENWDGSHPLRDFSERPRA